MTSIPSKKNYNQFQCGLPIKVASSQIYTKRKYTCEREYTIPKLTWFIIFQEVKG